MKIKYESVNEIKIRILEMRIFLCGKIENKIKLKLLTNRNGRTKSVTKNQRHLTVSFFAENVNIKM
ncbi:hypothetical protein HMPREF9083_0601 [Dialister micraerophilus DSM 19965]|uniref:Uncharacterized protein n=1 Tax=Dialister micraerophilus DSM 19965 TaxID=888062 RepID=F2BWN4_9FIRM|nr:hypothetical protein HMPREF9083_0601 [Dialister micraerophilus DSM 19965]